jgi:hypothetical protein
MRSSTSYFRWLSSIGIAERNVNNAESFSSIPITESQSMYGSNGKSDDRASSPSMRLEERQEKENENLLAVLLNSAAN